MLFKLQFSDAKINWKGKASDVNIRISFENQVIFVNLNEIVYLKFINTDESQLHLLVQYRHLAVSSFLVPLKCLVSDNKEKVFEFPLPLNLIGVLGLDLELLYKIIISIECQLFYDPYKYIENIQYSKEVITKDESNEDFEKNYFNCKDISDTEEIEFSADIVVEEIKNNSLSPTMQEIKLNKNSKSLDFDNKIGKDAFWGYISRHKNNPSSPIAEKFLNTFNEFSMNYSISLNLSKDSIKSSCAYIQFIKRCEFNEICIDNILSSLKKELRPDFLQKIGNSKKAYIPPVENIQNVSRISHTNSESEISFISTMKLDENIIEVPSNLSITIENLTTNNSAQLNCCIISLLGKLTQYETENKEVIELDSKVKTQDESTSKLQNFLLRSQTDHLKLNETISEFKNYLIEKIRSCKQQLKLKKINSLEIEHKAKALKSKIRELQLETQAIGRSHHWEVIKDLRHNIQVIESKRKQLDETFQQVSKSFKQASAKLTSDQIKVIGVKQRLIDSIKLNLLTRNDLLKENSDLCSKISKAQLEFTVYSSSHDALQGLKLREIYLENGVNRIKSSLGSLGLEKENQAKAFELLYKKIQNSIFELNFVLNNHIETIKCNNENLVHLEDKIKDIQVAINNLLGALASSLCLEAELENILGSACDARTYKDYITGEISYFSDFFFSYAQSVLEQTRSQDCLSLLNRKKTSNLRTNSHK
jgi:hypothetical protein